MGRGHPRNSFRSKLTPQQVWTIRQAAAQLTGTIYARTMRILQMMPDLPVKFSAVRAVITGDSYGEDI